MMFTPGAKRSLHEPWLVKLAGPSLLVDAATVITSGTLAGLNEQVVADSFPAAATTVMPSWTRLLTAVSNELDAGPPQLMLTTAGRPGAWSAMIQLRPSRIVEALLTPEHPKTLTGTIVTDLATPQVAPPTVPATCVPCPMQSAGPRPSPKSQ